MVKNFKNKFQNRKVNKSRNLVCLEMRITREAMRKYQNQEFKYHRTSQYPYIHEN